MVVRMRHTRAHTKNRRSHHGLKSPNLSTCSHCGASHRPHHMCLECGYYNGRQVMDMDAEKAKREARIKAKKEAIRNELGRVEETAPAQTEAPSADEVKPEAPVEEKQIQSDEATQEAQKENTAPQK